MTELAELQIQEIELDLRKAKTSLAQIVMGRKICRKQLATAKTLYKKSESLVRELAKQTKAEIDQVKRRQLFEEFKATREAHLTTKTMWEDLKYAEDVREAEYADIIDDNELFQRQGEYRISEIERGQQFNLWGFIRNLFVADTLVEIRHAAQKVNRS